MLLLEYADIEERTFGSWSMGFLKSSDIHRETLVPYTKGESFDPYLLTGDKALDFLIAITAQERKRLDMQP